MPIPVNVLKKYLNPVFVETGTLFGEAARAARTAGFTQVHTIDIDPGIIEGRKKDWAKEPEMHAYCGSSDKLLPGILAGITGRVTFWLDAHPPGNPLAIYKTPLFGELEAIKNYAATQDKANWPTVLIDDMRIFSVEDRGKLVERASAVFPQGSQISYEDSQIATADIMVIRPGL